jgi:hypothetical protein
MTAVRVVFVLVLLQALLVASALVSPDLIALVLPWPASPLNARFVAALYLMGAVSAVLSAFARRYHEVRISLVQVFAITGALLLLTLPHLGEFTAAGFPYRWLVLYALDVVVIGVLLWRRRGDRAAAQARHPAAAVLFGYALVAGMVGTVLLVAPDIGVLFWPWALTPILAQVYSVFFLVFALGAWLASRSDPAAGRISVTANLVMLLVVLAVSLVHLDRFAAGPRAAVWFGLFAVAAGALGVVLRIGRRTASEIAR